MIEIDGERDRDKKEQGIERWRKGLDMRERKTERIVSKRDMKIMENFGFKIRSSNIR